MLSVLNLLINNNKITANELAEKLEVSKRTIYRDIDALNMAGIPIITYPGIGGGLGVVPGYKIDKTIFSTDDMQNILIGLSALKSISDKTKLNNLITKITPQKDDMIHAESDILIDLSSWFVDSTFQNKITDFRSAILYHKVITLEYHTKSVYSKRNVEPYKLVFKYSFWYLYAYCLDKKGFRLFKLNRISTYEVLEEIFKPQIIDELKLKFEFETSYFKETETSALQEIILEYNLKDKIFLIDKIGAQSFKQHEGTGLIIFESSNLEWVADFIIGLQDKVKVVKPLVLLNDVKAKIEKMNSLYKS